MQGDIETLACRAIWRVNEEDILLAKNLISSKRLKLDDLLVRMPGVQYFISCITIMMSNSKASSSVAEQQTAQRDVYPGVAYFVAYRVNEACNENEIFAAFHNADMEPTISKVRAKTPDSSLFQVLKDHANGAVQNLVSASNAYCLTRAASELCDEEDCSVQTDPQGFPAKPCRIVVVNEAEILPKFMPAFAKLQSDGLIADIVALPNPDATTLPTNPSEVTTTIRDIDRVMELCDHALYRGNVYTRPQQSSMTFVHMMDVNSYLHRLLSNDSLRERVLKHFAVLSRTLGHRDCSVIRQLVFDDDLIEVLGGVVFQISSRTFIPCPIPPHAIRKTSPRSFVPYDSTTLPNAGYFKEAILNSFPNLCTRINFLNKFYQCIVAGKMPQKIRKLVVAGPKDSGKTSWAAIFHRLIPHQYIATITKERQFSAAMIDERTQLVIIDDWCATTMETDLAKTLLQGGWMATAVKYQQPRSFFNTCPFYLTTNHVPDFGKENDNVQRRLAVYHTKSLEETTVGADKWIYDNAMACIAWVAAQINAHLDVVDPNERWYENGEAAVITNILSRESLSNIARVSFHEINERRRRMSPRENSPHHEIHSSFMREAERITRSSENRRRMAETSSTTTDEQRDRPRVVATSDLGCSSNEPYVETDHDHSEREDEESINYYRRSPTQWQLNTNIYFCRVAALIETKFYGEKFKGKPTLAFRTRLENAARKEKDFWTKADPYIDTWFIILGQVREVFDLEAFVRAYPHLDTHIAELRKVVRRRVLHEDCPIVKMKRAIEQQNAKVQRSTTAKHTPPRNSQDAVAGARSSGSQNTKVSQTSVQKLNVKRKRKTKEQANANKKLRKQ